MIAGLTPEEARDLMLSVGTHHGKRRLSPVEVAELFQKSLMAGATPIQCARFVNLTGPTMITRFLSLLKLSPEIRHIVDWGESVVTISFASAWVLSGLSNDEQETAVREVMANQIKKDEVHQIIQLRKRSQRPIEECVNEVLRMRPVVSRRHVFLGAITDERVKKVIAALKQSDRDVLLATALKSIYGELKKTSGRLGVERFTIVTDDHGAARLKESGKSGFELVINQVLIGQV